MGRNRRRRRLACAPERNRSAMDHANDSACEQCRTLNPGRQPAPAGAERPPPGDRSPRLSLDYLSRPSFLRSSRGDARRAARVRPLLGCRLSIWRRLLFAFDRQETGLLSHPISGSHRSSARSAVSTCHFRTRHRRSCWYRKRYDDPAPTVGVEDCQPRIGLTSPIATIRRPANSIHSPRFPFWPPSGSDSSGSSGQRSGSFLR
jgi:hypothetical protein